MALIIIILVILFYVYVYFRKVLKLNTISIFVVLRGILTQNKIWWSLNDLILDDHNGNNLYFEYKKLGKDFIPINVMGSRMYLVYRPENIKNIMDNSPNLFGVGKLKKSFFETFMKDNVGVSEGKDWVRRRVVNENVLDTDGLHRYADHYNKIIRDEIYKSDDLKDFDDFSKVSKIISSKIVYGDIPFQSNFDVFDAANSMLTFIYPNYKINDKTMNEYIRYNIQQIRNPKAMSLVEIGKMHEKDEYELYHQIPHWLFPINGMSVAMQRFLTVVLNDSECLEKIKKEIRESDISNPMVIYNMMYLRKCILELLRLINPVNSSFRTLLEDLNDFKKGEQFIIFNNPVMRDPEYFTEPNRFKPERWDEELERKYYSISFNQGPQRCPGKELIIYLLKCFIIHYLGKIGNTPVEAIYIDTDNVPQTLNPFKINFVYN